MPSDEMRARRTAWWANTRESGRLGPGGVVRSMLRFMFVVVPTAVLATAVVVGVSSKRQGAAATADGDLLQDLKLASTTSLELAPAGQPLATVSALESAPSPTPEPTTRPKRSRSGSRGVRSHAPAVTVAAEPEVAEATDESKPRRRTSPARPSRRRPKRRLLAAWHSLVRAR